MTAPVFAVLMLLDLRASLSLGTGVIQLPPGETHLDRPLVVPKNSRHLSIRGHSMGSTLVLEPSFKGSAAIVVDGAADVSLVGFEVRGNRTELKSDWYLPLNEAPFADYYSDNGIVVRNAKKVLIQGVRFSAIRAFPVIIHASADVHIEALKIEDSGTLSRAGRNNTTGGILLEQGVSDFEVAGSTISRITGNAIWTHSYARSPRQNGGVIRGNTITTVGRDAIQVGHATGVRVEDNRGSELGFPADYVDVEHHGVAVALDTAGNVDHSSYTNNRFTDVNGQCIDLDGFHDGDVSGNACVNLKPAAKYPASHYGIVFGNNDPAADSSGIVVSDNTLRGFAYGAVFLVGSGNRVEGNRFLDMNRAHCGLSPVPAACNYALDQPDLLRSAIYLSANGGRPATTKGNVIRNNTASGFGMSEHCVAAGPGVMLAENRVVDNICVH